MLSQFSEAVLGLLAFSILAFWRGGVYIMRCPNCDSSPQAVYEAEVFYVSIVWKILSSSPSGSGMCGCVGVGAWFNSQGMWDVTSPKELRLPTHLPRVFAMKKGTWAWGRLT